MKKHTLLMLVVVLAFLVGCTVGFETTSSESDFSCETGEDCLAGYVCSSSNVCQRSIIQENDCDDADGDGYGVGDTRGNCKLCQDDNTKCDEDCAPDDPNVNPGAAEVCNNVDDNCNTDIDESIECTRNSDCGVAASDLGGVFLRCIAGQCVAQMTKTRCLPANPGCGCNDETLSCTDGAYPSIPEACQ